jgi:hypothetical protein
MKIRLGLWPTLCFNRKIQNDHTWKIHKLENKVLIQGWSLEDHDDMIRKLSGIVEKQGKVMDVLTVKIIHLESQDNDNGERLNNYSYHLGVLELPQPVRELILNSVYWI